MLEIDVLSSFDFNNQNHVVFLLLAVIITVLIFLISRYKLREYYKLRQVKKRFERGNKLELQAKKFLKSKGYTIVDYQSSYEHRYKVNGELQTAEIQPDYVVKKNGKKYIVEVKSGNTAINASNRNTRRQLLEYDYVVETDGVFLLDMENLTLKLIQFKSKAERRNDKQLKTVIIIALIAIAIPYWQLKVVLSLLLIVLLFFKRKY